MNSIIFLSTVPIRNLTTERVAQTLTNFRGQVGYQREICVILIFERWDEPYIPTIFGHLGELFELKVVILF